jgi:hypothetical protein
MKGSPTPMASRDLAAELAATMLKERRPELDAKRGFWRVISGVLQADDQSIGCPC